jgi:hypothetical protein
VDLAAAMPRAGRTAGGAIRAAVGIAAAVLPQAAGTAVGVIRVAADIAVATPRAAVAGTTVADLAAGARTEVGEVAEAEATVMVAVGPTAEAAVAKTNQVRGLEKNLRARLGYHRRCRTAQSRGNVLISGNPEPSLARSSGEGVETRRAAPKPRSVQETVKG